MERFRAWAIDKFGEEKCGFKTHILERRRQAEEEADDPDRGHDPPPRGERRSRE